MMSPKDFYDYHIDEASLVIAELLEEIGSQPLLDKLPKDLFPSDPNDPLQVIDALTLNYINNSYVDYLANIYDNFKAYK